MIDAAPAAMTPTAPTVTEAPVSSTHAGHLTLLQTQKFMIDHDVQVLDGRSEINIMP